MSKTKTTAEPKFLQQARKFFEANPPELTSPTYLEDRIQAYARELAVCHSPLGRGLTRLCQQAEALRKALREFEDEYEDDLKFEYAVQDALADANLKQGPRGQAFNGNHFNGLIEELRGLEFLTSLVVDLLEAHGTALPSAE